MKSTGKDVLFVGDLNVCREEIDIFTGYPPLSKRIAGLLPEEIENMKHYHDAGFIDTYRFINPDEDELHGGIQELNSIELNYGWRIDYGLASDISNVLP